ncbi:hypothetical protein [Acidipropionibacterium jensenii]|uniref:Uncharacterized protein n=1 Tax=Acidipropionibacterium jensenii TaxID=1749 RepID=A0A3Q9UHS1_9ACTN|nr:hypothetical protein [Acidipropionibacterium jensenii]AZZ39082.1 hypothetical protein C0Z10_04205 [Acidipropionibacterium jensenii]AZZ42528.1 hypothetical protein C0Z11_09810 [Acidipropionibacterium jensenii]MDN6762778.1 hypothetical protein [Acidipropionibacterium jensenii]VEI04306.1 Uncharacterised protein [Acidipropionibacterium jensenii]
MIIVLVVLAVACCTAVVWSAIAEKVPPASGWALAGATVATTVTALLAGDIPSRFAASVLAAGCMAESVWTMAASSWQRRRTARALSR